MTMSMSGAVKTCVTHDSAASESDVITALREALRDKKQELPRALCLKNSQFVSLHSLTRPRLPFWGLSPVSCLFLPCVVLKARTRPPTGTRHLHKAFHYKTRKMFWEEQKGKFWLCCSYFLAVELPWCGSKAAGRFPRGSLWLEEHRSGWMSDWYLQPAGDMPMAQHAQKNTVHAFIPDLFSNSTMVCIGSLQLGTLESLL